MVKPSTAYVTQKSLMWYGHLMRRYDKNVAKEITTMKVGWKIPRGSTDVDGLSAKRHERTSARSKGRTKQRILEKCRLGDRSRKGI